MMKRLKHTIFCLLVLSISVLPCVVQPNAASAQNILDPACDKANNQSTVCGDKGNADTTNPLFGKGGAITKITQLVALVVGIASVIMIVVGGLRYVFSRGESANVNNARNTILYAIVGLIVALTAQGIIALVLNRL